MHYEWQKNVKEFVLPHNLAKMGIFCHLFTFLIVMDIDAFSTSFGMLCSWLQKAYSLSNEKEI